MGWIDVSNLLSRAPFYQGAVYAKVMLRDQPFSKIFTPAALQALSQKAPKLPPTEAKPKPKATISLLE